MIIGHLATAVLLKHYFPEESPLPLFAGSIFPDLADKLLKYVLKLHAGRSLFHSVLGLLLTTAVLTLLGNKQITRSWTLGYLSHIVCDSGNTIPWLYPFRGYKFGYSPYTYPQKIIRTITHPQPAETLLVIWAYLVSNKQIR